MSDRFTDAEILLGEHKYRGRSIGGEETCHMFPSYDFCFDIGYAPISATNISQVFVTHGHGDHAGGLGRHAARRRLHKLTPATYYVPQEYTERVSALLEATARIEFAPVTGKVISVSLNDSFPLHGGRLIMRPFRAVHTIPTFGYCLYSVRKKLQEQYRNLSGAEIGQLRKSGVEVSETSIVPEITFCGDTMIDVVDRQECVRNSRFLLLECTMIDDQVTPEEVRKWGHIHLQSIIDCADQLQNEKIMLTHFSSRYDSNYIREVVTRKIAGSSLEDRTILLLP